ncbi:hypothetical protein [Streptomyces sp. NBC_01190]|uniref:hypothetical protein n=1 Tax=Streptomyces sp. NBC_01190 TaxID=2903767 RepID=UPI00386E5A52|nr:hypothetical protein OG519_06020 [Streptomyces sp. NBC_01190]
MGQQLAIIVLVDTGNALESRTLEGNTYLFDNMKLQGSEGEGTGDLVTAVNSSTWSDGSQASEAVLNWLPYSLGSIPPTVPRSYQADRARQSDQQALDALSTLADRPATSTAETASELSRIQRTAGTRVRSTARSRNPSGHKLLDVTGNIVTDQGAGAHSYPPPVITDITGEAVDLKIIYPAEYGSPDLVTDGWYWSATVDTSRPGTYAYTMHIQLHELVHRAEDWLWEPVTLQVDSNLKITSEPKRNAFTKAGLGLLPLPLPLPLPAPPGLA